jgi:hypothetical protein
MQARLLVVEVSKKKRNKNFDKTNALPSELHGDENAVFSMKNISFLERNAKSCIVI